MCDADAPHDSRNTPAERAADPAVLVRASNCVTRAIAGEMLIIPIARGTADLESIFTLNAVGSRVWELLAGPIAASRLAAAITEEFDVSPTDAARDVSEFLDSLHAVGLLAGAERRG